MPHMRKTKTPNELSVENLRLRAQVAQLQDRLDHLSTHGPAPAVPNLAGTASADLPEFQPVLWSVMSDVVLVADDSGRLTYASPNVHLVFGHTQEEVRQQGRIDALLPNDLFDRHALDERGEISNIECQIRDSVGRGRELLVSVKRVDTSGGTILYTCRETTEQRRTELELQLLRMSLDRQVEERTHELHQSSERYRRLVENLRDEYVFYATDPHGVITYVSPSIHAILGYTPDEVIGRNWRQFVDPEGPSYSHLEELERQRLAGLPSSPYEAEVLHANGEIRLLETRDHILRDNDGRVIASEGICKDITARRRADEELSRVTKELEHRVEERTTELKSMCDRLRDSELRYRSVVEDSPDFIVRWEGEGVRTFVNDSYCQYMGQDRQSLIGTSFLPSIVEPDREAFEKKLRRVAVGSPVVVTEQRVSLPDGRFVCQRWSHRALFDKDGNLVEFQAVGSDVTAHRVAKERVRDKAVAAAQVRNLTARERDVMRLVVAGNANKVIARKLDLSIKTIEKHRSRLMRKLRVRSVPELVRLALLAEPSIEKRIIQ